MPAAEPAAVFPATNWWNLDISAAPVDPSSTNFINFIGAGDRVHPDFGGTDGTLYGIYGMPFIVVNGSQPKKTVDFVLYPGESDGVGVPFYPIPDEAITQGHWIEGGSRATSSPPATGTCSSWTSTTTCCTSSTTRTTTRRTGSGVWGLLRHEEQQPAANAALPRWSRCRIEEIAVQALPTALGLSRIIASVAPWTSHPSRPGAPV